MNNLKKIPLSEVVSTVIDYRGKTPKKLGSDWANKGYRALSAKNVKTRKIVNEQSIRYVDENLYKKWMKEEIQRGDILITSEAPFGQIFFWDSDEKIVLSQRLFAIRCKQEFYPKYVFQYMTGENFQKELLSRATGTTVTGLRQSELLKCTLEIPEFANQVKIASTICAFDDKIALNNKIIKNLETQAQLIVLSTLNFEKTKILDDYAFINPKRSLKKGTSARYIDMSSLSTTSAIPIGYEFKKYSGGVKFSNGDSLLARITPCLENGKAAYINFLAEEEVAFGSTEFITFHTKGVLPNEFFYCLLRTQNFRQFAIKHLTGTSGRQRVSSDDIKSYPLPEFSPQQISYLNKNLPILFTSIASYEQENATLEKIRDSLLPKLMSGELTL